MVVTISNSKKPIIILGAGRHAKVLIFRLNFLEMTLIKLFQ